jgi:outer membrane protein W
MKKIKLILAIMLITFVSFGQVTKTDLNGKIGISLYGGVNIPATGNISSAITATDLLNPGTRLGLGVSYYFTKSIGIEAVFNYDVNIYNDKYKLNGKQPSVSVNSVSFNGIYNFGHLLGKNSISPFVRAGVGAYSWRHLDDTPWRQGSVITNDGIEQKATSFGFNAGIGADYSIVKSFTIGMAVDYNMYFPKDVNKYGEDFGSQGNFTPTLKLTYYLPTH